MHYKNNWETFPKISGSKINIMFINVNLNKKIYILVFDISKHKEHLRTC